jgi:alkylation response protein AidB-like acyl-CoA dehydrogenase
MWITNGSVSDVAIVRARTEESSAVSHPQRQANIHVSAEAVELQMALRSGDVP